MRAGKPVNLMARKTRNKKELLLEIDDLRAELENAREVLLAIQREGADVLERVSKTSALLAVTPTGLHAVKCVSFGTNNSGHTPAEQLSRLYHHTFDNANEGIVIQDCEGRIIEQNAAHRNLLGYTDEELLGKTPAHYLEEGKEEFWRTMDDLPQRRHCRGGTRCRSASGRWVEVELDVAVFRNDTDDVMGYATFLRDVSDKKRIEDALRESEERFAAFMNHSSVAAFLTDSKGRYAYVNRAFEKYVRKPSAEIVGKTAFDIWPAAIASELSAADKRVLAMGRPMELYERTALPGQEAREWLAIKFPFQDSRGKALVGCVSIDVTERKDLEERLRQSQKMEAVGRLAGGVAHDFNNLLTIITGYCELLLGSAEAAGNQRSKIEEIKKAGDRAAVLTRQLLAFSRKQVLAPQTLDLNEVIEDLKKMIQRLIGEDIELVTIPRSKLDQVKADPGQVEQIIMNLAVNARDAMPHGGKLTIETANAELDDASAHGHLPALPGNYVMIAVSDTGTGMDRETQKHIFEPFFTTKETGKGTGLGLSTVYGIVKQSGGFIWVYSEVGVGTTFKIYFPRVQEERESPVASKSGSRPLEGSETVLVAEDEDALRQLIRETLEGHGYSVLEAGNGKDALNISENFSKGIHLLVADVVMPQMSGRELVRRITAHRQELKVLYISGYTQDTIVHHGVLDPDIAFLQKPFSPDGLAKKVRQVLGQHNDSKP